MMVLAALSTALAVQLLLGLPRAGPRSPYGRGPVPMIRGKPWLLAAFIGIGAALLVALDGVRLTLALIILGCGGGVVTLARRARSVRAAETSQALVVEVCEALVGELRAGQPLVTSLEHCVEVWPAFEPVAAASRLGADVPLALRQLARIRGAEGLREIASAWQVAERSGAGLAAALSQVASTARERQATRHLVKGELASAQATARLVVLLPLASLAMSAGIGGDPWHFLLATPAGLGCLGVGALLAWTGLLWIDRIAGSVLRS
ncbi:MAG: type II secretion system F family protein [Nocardioidaceae bacterium]